MIRTAVLLLILAFTPYASSQEEVKRKAAKQEDRIKLETTRIKANKELPQILYIVPWKDFDAKQNNEHKLKLHDFFGELYQPVLPSEIAETVAKAE